MGVPANGEVVLVPFPFSDLSEYKIRPVVCLADAGRGDFVCCMVTSISYGDPDAEPLGPADFDTGGLLTPSFARPGKLSTLNSKILVRVVGTLTPVAFDRVRSAVVAMLRRSRP